MDKIAEFENGLSKHCIGRCADWHAIDLHNHSPASFDYSGSKDLTVAVSESAKRIVEADLSVVMFTDHGVLPSVEFTRELAKQTRRLILRGVELNVFVDAWEQPKAKVTKNLFFHLLLGFDPHGEEPAEYWLQHIYRNCDTEERDTGGHKIKGVSSLGKLVDVLAGSGAVIIPAHLHSSHDAFRSRSIDDIYADREFLKFATEHCTALEIRNDKTAAFFDGEHSETGNLLISCIRSSDSHEPSTLGSSFSWVQMEQATFGELKAALEMSFRFSRSKPIEPRAYIQGINIKGHYFEDLWLEFSPHCNVLMGVKGSGKTALLECLRFVLDADIPDARRQQVREHLEFILGPGGTVQVLARRHDGSKVLVQRSISSTDFEVWFPGDRREVFTSFDAIDFPTHILGWHEIERAAEDANIRRIYMDTIAGSARINALEREAKRLAENIREKHAIAASKYSVFRDLNDQTIALEERRRGLQELDDADLIQLHKEYEAAVQNVEVVRNLPRLLDKANDGWEDRWKALWTGLQETPFVKQSELASSLNSIEHALVHLFQRSNASSQSLIQAISDTRAAVSQEQTKLEAEFAAFKSRYDKAVLALDPDKRSILKSHQSVAEETAGLAALQKERDGARSEVESVLDDLAGLCQQVCEKLDERTRVRTEAISSFGKELSQSGVSLAVEPLKAGTALQQLRGTYRQGAQIFDSIFNGRGDLTIRHHASLAEKYKALKRDLVNGNSLFFSHPEFEYYLTYFEDDDLRITLEVGSGVEKTIDQLSAGQRCTAIFPLLLKLQSMPLVVDQPEDNLDNRHIASSIAPEVLRDKKERQMIFTSHNANLVVLSDSEMIVSFEGDGAKGWIENAGFLATRDSRITNDVLEVLDGGPQALELRYKKYGKSLK